MLGPLNFAASFLRDSTAGQLPAKSQLQLHREIFRKTSRIMIVFLIELIMPSGVTHKLMNPPKNHLIVCEPGAQKWAIGTKRRH